MKGDSIYAQREVQPVRAKARVLLVLLLLLCLTPGLASCSPAADSVVPPVFDLEGKDEVARLDALRAVARTAPLDVFYLGDPYDGMTMMQISMQSIGGEGPNSVAIYYGDSEGRTLISLTMYTPQQYSKSAYRDQAQTPSKKTYPIEGGTAGVY